MAPRAIIIGAPGAGKTSVGRRVAERLGVGFRDSDAAIEQRTGKPVSDIFLSEGESEFRRLEREVIAESLKDVHGVLSVGGGAVLDPDRTGLPWPIALVGALVLTGGFWFAGLFANSALGGAPANVLGFGIGEKKD